MSASSVAADSAVFPYALSVVVCTYNNAPLLAETLAHLQKQHAPGRPFEVLVIDNNCTDDTPRVVERFQPHVAHLRRIVETRQGQMYARVRGVQESRAPWIAFVDDDNLLDPRWIAAAFRLITAQPRCDAFGGKVVIDWEEPPPADIARRAYAYAATDLGPRARRLAGDERWRLRGAGLVCRKAALERCGWLDWQVCTGRAGRGTMSGDDTELVMRIARAGGELWYEPACQLQHRIARRRLTWNYLRSLHFSFALAVPLLLGLRSHGSLIEWAGRLVMLFIRRAYWLTRHSLRGLRDPDARATAVLSLDTLHGSFRGVAAVARMSRAERSAWLGASSAVVAEPSALRVLHVQNGRMYGGVQRMLACLAAERAQSPRLESVFAICFSERLAVELGVSGAQVEVLGPAQISRPLQWLIAGWRLSQLLARERFAAVVCHGSWPLALFGPSIRRRRVPLVLWMHNDTKIRNKNLIEILASRSRPDLVIANSAFTAASLPLLFRQPPPHLVLPCPVSRPAVATDRRAALRAELSTPADAVVIVLAGRPEPWKGHAELLDALARLRELPNWVCWIVGGAFTAEQTTFLASLESSVEERGISARVRFTGQREDVAELLAAADLFCQPNVTPEPFGIVFIEALYAGLPVVTTDHGGGREIVDASCGRLVPPGDPGALAGTIGELVRDGELRRTLSRGALPRGLQISDPSRVLPALQVVLSRFSPGGAAPRIPSAAEPGAFKLTPHG